MKSQRECQSSNSRPIEASVNTNFSPNKTIHLAGKPVYVYLHCIDEFIQNLPYFETILSEDERARACKFLFKKDQNRFIICRGLLREILTQYIKTQPENILFEYNQYGKPYLLAEQNPDNFQFNLSHSGSMVLIGITQEVEIGVDIEEMKEFDGMGDIIKRFGSSEKQESFNLCSDDDKDKIESFYRWFTKKEAYGKATGLGIQIINKSRTELNYNSSHRTFKSGGYVISVAIIH